VIAVCGEALMDLVDDQTQPAHPGGGPFNTARALARLGVPTAFVGRLSNVCAYCALMRAFLLMVDVTRKGQTVEIGDTLSSEKRQPEELVRLAREAERLYQREILPNVRSLAA
jgi:hypothetical protein